MFRLAGLHPRDVDELTLQEVVILSTDEPLDRSVTTVLSIEDTERIKRELERKRGRR